MSAVEATGLVRRFGDITALNGLDLRVGQGTLYGIIGPDGAGKTTFMRLAACLDIPDGGSISVAGSDTRRQQVFTPRPVFHFSRSRFFARCQRCSEKYGYHHPGFVVGRFYHGV